MISSNCLTSICTKGAKNEWRPLRIAHPFFGTDREEGIDHARTRLPPSPSRPFVAATAEIEKMSRRRSRSFAVPESRVALCPPFRASLKEVAWRGVGGDGVTLRSLAIFTSTFIQPQFKVSERGRKCQTHTNTLLARHSTFRFLHYNVKGCTNMF